MNIDRKQNRIKYVKVGDYFIKLDCPSKKYNYFTETATAILIAVGIIGFGLILY